MKLQELEKLNKKSKFNIGDKVYFLRHIDKEYKICVGFIFIINTDYVGTPCVNNNEISIIEEIYISKYRYFVAGIEESNIDMDCIRFILSENEIFKTKEELKEYINSL